MTASNGHNRRKPLCPLCGDGEPLNESPLSPSYPCMGCQRLRPRGSSTLAEGSHQGKPVRKPRGPERIHDEYVMRKEAVEIATAQRDHALDLLARLLPALDGWQPHPTQLAIFEAKALLAESGRIVDLGPPRARLDRNRTT